MVAIYNRILAAGYAMKYARKPNKEWLRDEEDCTNFVSQALYFGGWPMTAGAGNDDVTAWYNISDSDPWSERWARSSRTWGAAENFRKFLQFGGRAKPCAIGDLTIGDVVQHFVNGRTSHTMMITGKAASGPNRPATAGLNYVLLASYHSKDSLNVPLILLNSPYVNLFWKISDIVPDTDSFEDTVLEDSTDKRWSHSKRQAMWRF
jgi:Putative amidase domain